MDLQSLAVDDCAGEKQDDEDEGPVEVCREKVSGVFIMMDRGMILHVSGSFQSRNWHY